MKKIVSILIVLCMVLSCSGVTFAQTVDSTAYGLTFTLPDYWELTSDGDFVEYRCLPNMQEVIGIMAIPADGAYTMGLIDENVLKSSIREIYSETDLANNLSENLGVYVTARRDWENSYYEYHNNVTYYRYETAVTYKASGYYDYSEYMNIYITAKNGKLYFFMYEREMNDELNKSNHFNDVITMLDGTSYANGEIKILINNERIYPDSAPMIIGGRTLVPIRAVAEKLGYRVDWDGNERIVTMTSKDNKIIIEFQIDNKIAKKNSSQEITLDVPAVIIEGRTYLPVRAVAEAMEAKVDWDGNTRTVIINK